MARTFRPSSLRLDVDSGLENHGAALLLVIREGMASDWTSLCQAFNFDPLAFHSGHVGLKSSLEDLIVAGLLISQDGLQGPYEIPDHTHQLLAAMDISLTQAANMPYFSGLGVRPVFGKPQLLPRAPHVFVVMPFQRDLRPVYSKAIKPACGALKLSVERADDIFSTSPIITDIWESLANCGVVIADCTTRNPNVFYEIGVTHALGRPTVLLAQNEDDVPFDVAHIRFIKYEPTALGLRRLKAALTKTLRSVASDYLLLSRSASRYWR